MLITTHIGPTCLYQHLTDYKGVLSYLNGSLLEKKGVVSHVI